MFSESHSRYFPKIDEAEPPPDGIPTGHLLNVRVTGRYRAMIAALSKRRFDEQLEAILDDAGDWRVNGAQGIVLCDATSLRIAIEKAIEINARGHEIVALVHRSRPEIIVFASQFQRLASRVAKLQYYQRAVRA